MMDGLASTMQEGTVLILSSNWVIRLGVEIVKTKNKNLYCVLETGAAHSVTVQQ